MPTGSFDQAAIQMPFKRHLPLLKAFLSFYWRHPWQTLFLCVGLVSGVALWSAVQVINQQAVDSYQQADQLLGLQAHYWIQSQKQASLSEQDYINLRRAGFRQIFPVIEAELSTTKAVPLNIIATDLMLLPNPDGSETTLPDFAEQWLSYTSPPFRSWIPEALMAELEISPSDQIELRDGRLLPPALLQNRSQQGRRIVLDIAAAFELQQRRDFSYLVVGEITSESFQRLKMILPEHLEIVENYQQFDLQTLTESLHTHLQAMSLLSFAVGLFIVFNAVRFSLWYRQPTITTCRLIGVTRSQLINIIALETLIWSILGSGIGFALGLQLGQLLLPGLSASLQSLYSANVDTTLDWNFISLLKAWFMTFSGLAFALAWPLFLLLKHHPLQAAKQGALFKADAKARRNLAIASIVTAFIALIVTPIWSTAAGGLMLLGLILFTAAWILPQILATILQASEKLMSTSKKHHHPGSLFRRWLFSDGWIQLPAFRTAMMALLLAITANLGVGTLVDSFRTAFTDWLNARQSADIYLRDTNIDARKLIQAGISQGWLKDHHHRSGITTRWQNQSVLLRGVNTKATDMLELPLAKWSGNSADQARKEWQQNSRLVFANEQAHYRAGLEVGDEIKLNSDKGPQLFRIAGFFYDYGNPKIQFYMDSKTLKDSWPNYYSRGLALWLDQTSDTNVTQKKAITVIRQLGAVKGDWILQSEIRQLTVGIFDRTFAITSSMNLLTLSVAMIALLAALLAILQSRMPQFAQWRALGLRQTEQWAIVATPLFLFTFVTWLTAIPLGALLSWILIDQINIVSFGWSMPMQWDPEYALELGGFIIIMLIVLLLLVSWQWRRRLPQAMAGLGDSI